MTTTFATPYSGYNATPAQLPTADNAYGSKLQIYRAVITLAAQASGDTIKLFKLPKGCVPILGVINSDQAFGGTATVAIGISGTTGKYRAAALKNTTTPDVFMVATANVTGGAMVPLASEEEVLLTIAAAALPGSGTCTVDMIVASL
jgi:hypothetical protein